MQKPADVFPMCNCPLPNLDDLNFLQLLKPLAAGIRRDYYKAMTWVFMQRESGKAEEIPQRSTGIARDFHYFLSQESAREGLTT